MQVREYNRTKKLNAIVRSKKGKGASDWIENTIKKKFEDIPLRETPTLREKAKALAAVESESVSEVDILQSIIIRENLLKELESLLRFQSDIDSVLGEAAELVLLIYFISFYHIISFVCI
jgi:fructose-bisphosphate aldolase class 1